MREGIVIIVAEVKVSALRYVQDELWLGFVDSICERVGESVGASRGVMNSELVSATYKFKDFFKQIESDNLRVDILKKKQIQKKKKKTKPATRRATLFKKQ